MRESEIEKKVKQYARSKGVLAYKFVSPARRACPDDLFLCNGHAWFIEFKQKGKKPTKLQEKRHRELRQHGFQVHVVDDVEQGRRVVDTELRNAQAN